MKALFGVRVGFEDWQEELLAENPEHFEVASKWALANGFDRLRVVTIEEGWIPDFGKCVNI